VIRIQYSGECPQLPEVERVTYRQRVLEKGRGYQIVEVRCGGRFASSAPYPPAAVPADVSRYVEPSRRIQSDNQALTAHSRSLVSGAVTQEDAVWQVIAWVVDNLTYEDSQGPNDAVTVWETRKARCEGYATLSCALLRAAGIPARFIYMWAAGDDSPVGPHAEIEVWYPDCGWVPYEPQGVLASRRPTDIHIGIDEDSGYGDPEQALVGGCLEEAIFTVLSRTDETQLIDVRPTPSKPVIAYGDPAHIRGATLTVGVCWPGGRPIEGAKVTLRDGRGGLFTLDTSAEQTWSVPLAHSDRTGEVLAQVNGQGVLSIAGLQAQPLEVWVHGPSLPMAVFELSPIEGRLISVGVQYGYAGELALVGPDAPLASPRSTLSIVFADVSDAARPPVEFPNGLEFRIYTGDAFYSFDYTALKSGKAFDLRGLPAGEPAQSPTLTCEGPAIKLSGLSAGALQVGFRLPGLGEERRAIAVEPGRWLVYPAFVRAGQMVTGSEATRYLIRLTRSTAGLVTVEVNGKAVIGDVDPLIKDDRTMLPLRAVCEALGASVSWDPKTYTALVDLLSTTVALRPDDSTALVNGVPVRMDVAPFVVNGRMLVPVRFLAKSFGLRVDWNETWHTVAIESTRQR
jgi:hypothetical protein